MHYKPPNMLSLRQSPSQCLKMPVDTVPPEENRTAHQQGEAEPNSPHTAPSQSSPGSAPPPAGSWAGRAVQRAPQRFGSGAASRCPCSTRFGGVRLPAQEVLSAFLLLAAVRAPRCARLVTQASWWPFRVQSHVPAMPEPLLIRLFRFRFTPFGRWLYAFRSSLQTHLGERRLDAPPSL